MKALFSFFVFLFPVFVRCFLTVENLMGVKLDLFVCPLSVYVHSGNFKEVSSLGVKKSIFGSNITSPFRVSPACSRRGRFSSAICSPCWARWWLRPRCRRAFPARRLWASTDECRPLPSPRWPSPPCTPSSGCRSLPGEHSGTVKTQKRALRVEMTGLRSWECILVVRDSH